MVRSLAHGIRHSIRFANAQANFAFVVTDD